MSAELTDVRDNTEIWGHRYSGKGADIVSLQQQIAGDIAGKLRSKLSRQQSSRSPGKARKDPEAYSLYLKGRYAWNKRTPADLRRPSPISIKPSPKDPNYALAYSGLADAYSVLPNFGGNPSEDYPKSNRAARRALELDATSGSSSCRSGQQRDAVRLGFCGGRGRVQEVFRARPQRCHCASVVRGRYWHDWGQRTGSPGGSQSCA